MNKFQKIGTVVAASAGMLCAQNLWTPDVFDTPSLQVQIPDLEKCNASGPENVNTCFEEAAGWWFGYGQADGGVVVVKLNNGACSPAELAQTTFTGDKGTPPATVTVPASECWKNFEEVDLADRETGNSVIPEGGLTVKIATPPTDYVSGIGFKFYPDPGKPYWNGTNPRFEDIGKIWNGYKIKYDLESTQPMELELGWDEPTYCYDTFYAPLTPGTDKEMTLTWDAFGQDGWLTDLNLKEQTKCAQSGVSHPVPIETALAKAEGVKIRLKKEKETINATFTIKEFSSIVIGGNPIIKTFAQNGLNFSLQGRMLSASVAKAASVQIINLQGVVVHTQTVSSASDKINLSKLPAGVYIARMPSLGYTNRIMLQ